MNSIYYRFVEFIILCTIPLSASFMYFAIFDRILKVNLSTLGIILGFSAAIISIVKFFIAARSDQKWTALAKLITDGITIHLAFLAIVFFVVSMDRRSNDEAEQEMKLAAMQSSILDQIHQLTQHLCAVEKRAGLVPASVSNDRLICPR